MGYFNKINRIVALAASLTLCGVCLAQSARHQEALEKMTVRIDSIVQRAAVPLDLSDPSSPARITSSQIFFDPDDMTEIQKYGPRAVPVLAKFLLNRRPNRTCGDTALGRDRRACNRRSASGSS